MKQSVSWAHEKIEIPGLSRRLWDTELGLQIYCAHWLRVMTELKPKDRRFKFWHHSANERLGGAAGFMAKMSGQSKGFPDMINIELRLAIELKVKTGKMSRQQTLWLNHLKTVGWKAVMIRRFEDFKELVLAQPIKAALE